MRPDTWVRPYGVVATGGHEGRILLAGRKYREFLFNYGIGVAGHQQSPLSSVCATMYQAIRVSGGRFVTSGATTALLYQTDSYLRTFSAQVVFVDPAAREIALDQTAFYPGGGGQPHDTGQIRTSTEAFTIDSLRKDGASILHHVAGVDPLPDVGTTVEGELDWERRYRLMRTHTALHVLCGVVFRDYGSQVTGGNMGLDHGRLDFEMDSSEFTPERVAAIEQTVNAEIAANHDIVVQILPRDEAFAIPDLIRTKINLLPPDIAEIRTVNIVGLDLQADGGTHVANTSEVVGIEVKSTRSKGKINKRIEIALIDLQPVPTSA